MNRCAITYEPCKGKHSQGGLKHLHGRLAQLNDLPFTAKEQRKEAASRQSKMSIQGVQPKLNARLSVKEQAFEIVDIHGRYIIKPQSEIYTQLPENESITMKMASAFGIETPFSGLVYSKDGSRSYFVRRFDRYGHNKKFAVEDFAQLSGEKRDTKYNFSMEKLLTILDEFCTFPMIDKARLLRRVLFCFVTGNEDMHLKNFSLIRNLKITKLSPAYDLLNTTIAMTGATEELALPLAGKKRKITAELLFDYYAKERMGLNEKMIESIKENLEEMRPEMENLIRISFLNEEMQAQYLDMMEERYKRLLK